MLTLCDVSLCYKDLSEKLQRVRPNSHGVSVLPFLSGERTPGWVEDATCAISGITKWTTPVEILHAALESVALRISLVFSLLGALVVLCVRWY